MARVKRDDYIRVKLHPEEKKRLENLADLYATDISDLIRKITLYIDAERPILNIMEHGARIRIEPKST